MILLFYYFILYFNMPLLDPPLQYALVCQQSKDSDNDYSFLLKYLKTAGDNIALHSELQVFEASIKFKKDLIHLIPFLANILQCKITENDLKAPTIKNYYKFIYDRKEKNYLAIFMFQLIHFILDFISQIFIKVFSIIGF